jgi:hypothetical protein
MTSYGWARTEFWFGDLSKTGEALRLLTPGMEAQFWEVDAGPGKILLTTTWNAPRRRALLVNLERPAPGDWKEIIPEAADILGDVTVSSQRPSAVICGERNTRASMPRPKISVSVEASLPARCNQMRDPVSRARRA